MTAQSEAPVEGQSIPVAQEKSTRQLEQEALSEDLEVALNMIDAEDKAKCLVAAKEITNVLSRLSADIAALAIGLAVVELQEKD